MAASRLLRALAGVLFVALVAAAGALGYLLTRVGEAEAARRPRQIEIDPPLAARPGEAVALLERALLESAHAQAGREPSGSDLEPLIVERSDGIVVTGVADASGFCLEAVHADLPGLRRRYFSLTSEIDAGRCDPTKPVLGQMGRAVEPAGGFLDVTDVRLVERDSAPGRSTLGRRYELVFTGAWAGLGDPGRQWCRYEVADPMGEVFLSGTRALAPETGLHHYVVDTFYESVDFADDLPVEVNVACSSAS